MEKYHAICSDETGRVIVGIGGIPGSAKSTISTALLTSLSNKIGKEKIAVVPMDGFHLTRAQLAASVNPPAEWMISRRGSPPTFDALKYLNLMKRLREPISNVTIYAPSFDNGVGDPVLDAIQILPHHRVIITEGNYLFLDEDIWRELPALFDVPVFLNGDLKVAGERVALRHLKTGSVRTLEDGVSKVARNDSLNSDLILSRRVKIENTFVVDTN